MTVILPGDRIFYKRKVLLKEKINSYPGHFLGEDTERKGFCLIRLNSQPQFTHGQLLSVPPNFLTAHVEPSF